MNRICCCCGERSKKDATAAMYDVREGFTTFDKNQDGLITVDEICQTFKEMEMPISTDDALMLLTEFDTNGDGKLDFNEFVAFMKKYIRTSGDNGSLSMFFHFDRDGDGYITVQEFRESMKMLGLYLSVAETEDMLSPFFKDDERKLCYDDFHILMQRFI
ncbi:calmodulin-4-like [Physella acuta]|uniref:calmodulin-4-like n=1 Tax=Physella acuta TaxID=109671 RepID=UPI0027DCB964|nr:calmodulin-4-like [Physella acuta]